ncbi:MAG: ABC transporter permease [Deltaproteobacteria bacterium]|nr:ABC transporter permease [Deltaproteobacteria bacterium]MCB9785603.1 ABC transporter permease [Deltaproteobacteria bacterium]
MSREFLLWHFFREAWKNIRAAPALTVVAILTIAVSLILVGFFAFLMFNANRVLDGIAEDLRVTVYLSPDATAEQIDALQLEIAERDEVAQVTYLTAEEDLARNVALLSPELLEGLDAGAIPGQPAIDVLLRPRQRTKEDFARISAWLEELSGTQQVQELYFGADKIRILFAIIDLIRLTGLIICAIVLAAAVFFTFSTIKLAVYARREEIEVLRLVGATDRFIKAPFFIEGALAGLSGAAVALVLVATIHTRLLAFVEEEHFLNLSLDLMPAGMVMWLFIGGVGLGVAGSWLSVGRYLRT